MLMCFQSEQGLNLLHRGDQVITAQISTFQRILLLFYMVYSLYDIGYIIQGYKGVLFHYNILSLPLLQYQDFSLLVRLGMGVKFWRLIMFLSRQFGTFCPVNFIPEPSLWDILSCWTKRPIMTAREYNKLENFPRMTAREYNIPLDKMSNIDPSGWDCH